MYLHSTTGPGLVDWYKERFFHNLACTGINTILLRWITCSDLNIFMPAQSDRWSLHMDHWLMCTIFFCVCKVSWKYSSHNMAILQSNLLRYFSIDDCIRILVLVLYNLNQADIKTKSLLMYHVLTGGGSWACLAKKKKTEIANWDFKGQLPWQAGLNSSNKPQLAGA